MTRSNAMIIRKAYEDFAQGNVPAVFAAFDPSITWHVPGHSPLSGDYNGHDQVGSFFQRTMELSGGTFSIDVHNVLAKGDLVVVLATVNALRSGVSESFPEVHVWQMRHGKAVEFRDIKVTNTERIVFGPELDGRRRLFMSLRAVLLGLALLMIGQVNHSKAEPLPTLAYVAAKNAYLEGLEGSLRDVFYVWPGGSALGASPRHWAASRA